MKVVGMSDSSPVSKLLTDLYLTLAPLFAMTKGRCGFGAPQGELPAFFAY